ncbi:Hemolysin-type calcium-binding region OS=Microcoleus vaginatus FGP-2 GN=MicvaDRAFT_3802 PE=4 SV=1: DUF4394: VCBS: FG-GAP [Gemmata massiliana]|uniref:DUF4394 domain-containing protein n=1 Tax=Gemmata massiliana TaxID=1210884 RepID=A0A6P2CWK0_9BACT|nr:DUF4394 domain-containing protein [Gemmata massiliana]VTR92766.1 Hemolysin-type calcium-binding region OS=Microcoleus vaginatus FGP-2 GN=MicvaDRAFT_3802 PE=4 SV=1: DUF4394: VCBS: FG-GAP [Gemmata massiliana]
MPAIVYGLTGANALVRFDSAAPTPFGNTLTITGLRTGTEHVIGIDFRPRTGQLYATTVPTGSTTGAALNTYTINLQTGAATFVGAVPGTVPGAADVGSGYAFDPTTDRIRLVNASGENARIDPNTGALAGDDTNLTFATPGAVVALAYDRNFDRATGTAIPTTLYGIDRGTNSLVTIGGINGASGPNGGAVTAIGALGVALDAGTAAGFSISPGATGGTGLATLTVGGVTGLYSINLTTGRATLLGKVRDGAAPVTGLAVVPNSTVVIGSGPGANGDVRILDSDTGAVRAGIVPFAGFTGGVRVASGDVNGDGVPDAIVTAVAAQGHVKVFDGITGAELYSFFAFAGFNGTVNVAAGDVNGDGFADIIVAANGVNGHVKAFSGRDGALLSSFLAYPGFMGNTTVAAADFDLDGRDEIVTAAAVNGHVKVFSASGNPFAGPAGFSNSFLVYPGVTGDVFLAVGDVSGDGPADIVTISSDPATNQAMVFSGKDGSVLANFRAHVNSADVDIRQFAPVAGVGVADVDGDGRLDIVVSPATGGAPFTPGATNSSVLSAYGSNGTFLFHSIRAFQGYFGPVTVAGARA